jgi:hypothetical protein
MTEALHGILREFTAANGFRGKGPLCVALVVTDHARRKLPLDPRALKAESGGQVLGLGRSAVQGILKKYGIARVLASEGGRTSRGSIANMEKYVALLNDLYDKKLADLDAIERFWIDRVREFFAAKPLSIRLDPSRGLRAVISDVLTQAEARQKESSGTQYAGAVLQHLVGARLDCALEKGAVSHHCFSAADSATARTGDFFIGDVVIHVTTSPSEALLEKCVDNLSDGYRPLIVTTKRGLPVAEGWAQGRGIADRLDVLEIEQFLAMSLYERGKFAVEGRRTAIAELVDRYNRIIDEVETDPSLKISLR